MNIFAHFIARKYIDNQSRIFSQEFPQLACYSFDYISNRIAIEGQYERDELQFLAKSIFPNLPKGSVCLDIGANIGNHSLSFSRHFSTVIAFEPHPRNFMMLSINAQLANNIIPLNVGASSSPGSVQIVENILNLGGASIHRKKETNEKTVSFELVRIDDVAEVKACPAISFMKFDIEGHELQAIMGAKMTIEKHQPIITLEVWESEVENETVASVEALREMGYKYFYKPVSGGILGKAPPPFRKLLRTLKAIITMRRPSKAERLVSFDKFEQRDYAMVLCATSPLI